MVFEVAKEIVAKKGNWINSRPLTLKKLRGKAVLLDFWAYSCVNCIRTLPALNEMWKKYGSRGLVIVGIHTPEFGFEKDLKNVKAAVKRLKIKYPVLSDPKRINWENYGNKYWPRSALISADTGRVIMEHIGESGYDEIEERIAEMLLSSGKIKNVRIMKEQKRVYPFTLSPETYAGSLRNTGFGSGVVCTKQGCDEYVDPAGLHSQNILYPHGEWGLAPEYLEFKGKYGHLSFLYFACEVNIVIGGKGVAEVLLDKEPLAKQIAGKDIVFNGKKSFVKIDGPSMYNIIKSEKFHQGDLSVIPFKGMRVYAYTFG